MGEIGAGILPVAVQEEVVQLVRQIVVVRDVGLRPRDRIVLMEAPQQRLAEAPGAPERMLEGDPAADRADVHEVVERALLDRQRAVHIGLADMEIGVEREAPVQRPVVQADGHLGPFAAPDPMTQAVGIDDRQPTPLQDPPGELREHHCVEALPSALVHRRPASPLSGSRMSNKATLGDLVKSISVHGRASIDVRDHDFRFS